MQILVKENQPFMMKNQRGKYVERIINYSEALKQKNRFLGTKSTRRSGKSKKYEKKDESLKKSRERMLKIYNK